MWQVLLYSNWLSKDEWHQTFWKCFLSFNSYFHSTWYSIILLSHHFYFLWVDCCLAVQLAEIEGSYKSPCPTVPLLTWRPQGLEQNINWAQSLNCLVLDSQLLSHLLDCNIRSSLAFGVCDEEMFVNSQTEAISQGYSRSGLGRGLNGFKIPKMCWSVGRDFIY